MCATVYLVLALPKFQIFLDLSERGMGAAASAAWGQTRELHGQPSGGNKNGDLKHLYSRT